MPKLRENILFRRQSSSPFYSPSAISMQLCPSGKSLDHKAGTRLTRTTQETLSSPAMSFTTTWRPITGFHGKTCSTYLVRSCMAVTSLMTGTDVCARSLQIVSVELELFGSGLLGGAYASRSAGWRAEPGSWVIASFHYFLLLGSSGPYGPLDPSGDLVLRDQKFLHNSLH